jgi:hypothetical protein
MTAKLKKEKPFEKSPAAKLADTFYNDVLADFAITSSAYLLAIQASKGPEYRSEVNRLLSLWRAKRIATLESLFVSSGKPEDLAIHAAMVEKVNDIVSLVNRSIDAISS